MFIRDNPNFSSERTMSAKVQLKKVLAVSLKGLGVKTN
jgi:hypothetical protein